METRQKFTVRSSHRSHATAASAALLSEVRVRLEAMHEAWEVSLPPAAISWTWGAAYLRENPPATSIEAQLRSILAYCREKAIRVRREHLFVDIGSGLDDRRLGLAHLRQSLATAQFGVLCVTSNDRLTRDRRELADIVADLDAAGVRLAVPGSPSVTESPRQVDFDFEPIFASMSQRARAARRLAKPVYVHASTGAEPKRE